VSRNSPHRAPPKEKSRRSRNVEWRSAGPSPLATCCQSWAPPSGTCRSARRNSAESGASLGASMFARSGPGGRDSPRIFHVRHHTCAKAVCAGAWVPLCRPPAPPVPQRNGSGCVPGARHSHSWVDAGKLGSAAGGGAGYEFGPYIRPTPAMLSPMELGKLTVAVRLASGVGFWGDKMRVAMLSRCRLL
jgi:hypothetical protein